MKWIIALLVSAAMFYVGFHHASRYETDETKKPGEAETEAEDNAEAVEPAS